MGEDCWKVIGLAIAVVGGLVVAVGVIWKAYQSALREIRALQLKLVESKDERVHELDAFKKIVEDRLRGTQHGRPP